MTRRINSLQPLSPAFRVAIRLCLTILCLVSVASFGRAAGAGTSAAPFLKLGFGARPMGMGEAFVALADDASALYYNPAGIAFPWASPEARAPRNWEILVAHSLHVQDVRISQLGLLRRPFGLSLTYLSLNDIEGRTSESDAPDNTFGASDLALGLSYARSFGGLGLGVTAKYVQEKISTYSSDTFTADLGGLYRLRRWPLSFGASIANLGGQIRFIDQAAPLPTTLRLGVSGGLTPKFPAALNFQIDLPRDDSFVYRFGMEYQGFGPFSLRAGYMAASASQRDAVLGRALGSSSTGLSELFGFFMGVGFRFRQGSLDYALVPYGELGNAHRFSIGLRF